MLRIGEFSRLARVSVKALRLYDRLKLLSPARTDEWSGYRYYSGEQLPRLNAILALKDLGFSLEQIKRLLDEGLSEAQIRAMLEMKREEVEQTMQAARERLDRVEARLKRMDREGGVLGGYEVVLKKVEALRVASVRDTLSAYSDVGRLFDELSGYAERHGIRSSAWISVWHDREYRDEDVDGEAAFATEDSLPEDGRIRENHLPAVESMAATVHHGSFGTIGSAYAALLDWIEANGYRVAGPNREIYLRGGDRQDDPDYITEVQFPIKKADEKEKQ